MVLRFDVMVLEEGVFSIPENQRFEPDLGSLIPSRVRLVRLVRAEGEVLQEKQIAQDKRFFALQYAVRHPSPHHMQCTSTTTSHLVGVHHLLFGTLRAENNSDPRWLSLPRLVCTAGLCVLIG